MKAQVEAPWAKLPLHVLNDETLSAGDLRVYGAIDYLCGKRGWWYGPQERIAETAGVSPHTVIRAVQALREREYISTVRLGLTQNRVIRYFVHARTTAIDAVSVTATDGTTELPSVAPTVTATRGSSSTTDVPIDVPPADVQRAFRAAAAAAEVSPELRRAFTAWEQQSPGGLLKPIADHLADALEAYPVEWIEQACRSAAENGGYKPWKYIDSTLQRMKREGGASSRRQSNGRAPEPRDPYADFKTPELSPELAAIVRASQEDADGGT